MTFSCQSQILFIKAIPLSSAASESRCGFTFQHMGSSLRKMCFMLFLRLALTWVPQRPQWSLQQVACTTGELVAH